MSLATSIRTLDKKYVNLHHGVPVLRLVVGDTIPTPRAPERYAVRVYPDLARHLLKLNHEHNRGVRGRIVKKFADDMRAGLWRFTPESVVFSTTGILQNGQHRLNAVIDYGSDVWMMFDFGWPDEIIAAIDRGSARTNADALTVMGKSNAAQITAAISLLYRYRTVVGNTRGFTGLTPPSAQLCLVEYERDEEGWTKAAHMGRRTYEALEKSLGNGWWAGAYYILAQSHPEKAEQFFERIIDGREYAESPTRKIALYMMRRPIRATRTGDDREQLEIVIRAFNAWMSGRALSMPSKAGFELSRVR